MGFQCKLEIWFVHVNCALLKRKDECTVSSAKFSSFQRLM